VQRRCSSAKISPPLAKLSPASRMNLRTLWTTISRAQISNRSERLPEPPCNNAEKSRQKRRTPTWFRVLRTARPLEIRRGCCASSNSRSHRGGGGGELKKTSALVQITIDGDFAEIAVTKGRFVGVPESWLASSRSSLTAMLPSQSISSRRSCSFADETFNAFAFLTNGPGITADALPKLFSLFSYKTEWHRLG